ncbi:MAG: hypothetical protein OEY49_03760 [Candidatus Heimdallarchaeota archaeon]|nr:hypothetical protein [Candidatus Heimdallarchaeota archaeon]
MNNRCSNCNANSLIPITYGKPTESKRERAAKGEIILAGCKVPTPPLKYHCISCKESFT